MDLEFLDGQPPEGEAAPAPVPVRDENGRFASQQQESVEQAAPLGVEGQQQEGTSEPLAPPADTVPLAALHEERRRRQAAETARSELEARFAGQQQDEVYVDPDTESLVRATALQTKLDISEDAARDKYGDELVDAARDAALAKYRTSPAFREEVLSQRNPYRHVVEWYQREQALSALTPDDLKAFNTWKASQTVSPPPPPPAPPRSLASAPAAGSPRPGEQPVGPGVAFDATFKG